MRKPLVGAILLAVLLVGPACSSGGREPENPDTTSAGVMSVPVDQRSPDPAAPEQVDGGIGEGVEVGNFILRLFDVRIRDRIYSSAGPGLPPASREGSSSEYVAVDYVVRNVSDSPLRTGATATLLDDRGNSYRQYGSIRPPSGGTAAMRLQPDQTRASTTFFKVPNGTIPQTLEVEASGDTARFDLLERNPEKVPPEDYLRIYHLYFNERAYEEAYELLDPTSVQGITLGEWLSFYEPQWGRRYVGLDSLRLLSKGSDHATFQMDRTFYDADGDPATSPELNSSVTQEMVKVGGEWKLIMRDDLLYDIIAVIGPDETPAPETTTPERTQPPTTVPETTKPSETTAAESTTSTSPVKDFDCTDFESQEEAQLYLAPGDPYHLDEDNNGLACETLP